MRPYITIVYLLLICSYRTAAQTPSTHEHHDSSIATEGYSCRGQEFSFQYPTEEFNKTNYQNYAEGFFIALTYNDSSYIQIHCGGAVARPLLQGAKYMAQIESKHDGVLHRDGHIRGTDLL